MERSALFFRKQTTRYIGIDLLFEISYFPKQASDTMIHARINHRLQFRKIYVKSILTFKFLINLDILYSAEKSS